MKALSKFDKLKAFIFPKMKDLIIFLKNKGKPAIYREENIHGLYCYLEFIGDQNTITDLGQPIIILIHHITPIITQCLSIYSFHLSALDRKLFANAVA